MGGLQSGLSRRGFMGGVGAGGLARGARRAGNAGTAGAAAAIDVSIVTMPVSDAETLPAADYLVNVRLETGFVTPLNDKGEQAWPKVGDDASFNLVPASCSAEAVARLPARNAVVHNGKLACGVIAKAS